MEKSEESVSLVKHLRCSRGDINKKVLLPGDPGRVFRIAKKLDESYEVARNREFVIFNGTKDGEEITICSTGIGGPSAAIALEELIQLGADTFIRIGSAGGRKAEMPIGSCVIVNSAYRAEGTSHEYFPSSYPAVADFEVTRALQMAAEKLGINSFLGGSLTRDAYYVQNKELNNILLNTQVIVSEMECATLFVVGGKRSVRVGAIVGTDSNILIKDDFSLQEKERLFLQAEEKIILVGIEALKSLGKS